MCVKVISKLQMYGHRIWAKMCETKVQYDVQQVSLRKLQDGNPRQNIPPLIMLW